MELRNLSALLSESNLKNGPMPVSVRKERLTALKKIIQEKEALISEALKEDLGKSNFEAYVYEIGFILEEIGHTIKKIESWCKPRKVSTPLNLFPGKSFIKPQPYGVVLLISPWNYPFQLCLSPFIGAIAAGNRVVVKPSEFAPKTSSIIKILLNTVFKPDEVQVVEGGVEETQILLKQKFDYIFFTGSTSVGKVMMKAAAEHLTPVTLELGGKSPLVIHESANIDMTAKRCAWGKFVNSGQTCVAPDFVVIPAKLQNAFIERLKHYVSTFYGSNAKASPDYPRIVNEKHFDRLKELIDPAKIAFGGKMDRNEKFIEPTVIRDVDWKDKVMEDEIFGPILPIIPYESLDEAITKIQEFPKPLAFYVFSEDVSKSHEIMSKVSFGGGCINDTLVHLANPNLPFGGVGTSGIGSYHGKRSFDTFTHYKSIYQQGTSVDIPLRYPPYEGKLRWLKLLIR
jgi:aldehyde dehydrogenase (NAD+)